MYVLVERNSYGVFVAWTDDTSPNLVSYESYEGKSYYEWLWDKIAIKALIENKIRGCRKSKTGAVDFPIRELLSPVVAFYVPSFNSGPMPSGPVAFEREVRRMLPYYVTLTKDKLMLSSS